MSSLIIPGGWGRYPDYNVGIDRSNHLGRTITNLIRFGVVNRDIVTNQLVTFGSGGTIEASQYGKVLNGTAASAARASVFLDLSAYDKLTISFLMYWDSYADNDNLAMEFSSISTAGFTIDPNNSSPSGTFSFLTRSAGSAVYKNARFARPSGGWHHYVFTFDRTASAGNLGLTLSIDGVQQSLTAVDSSATTGNFASATLHLLSRNGTSLRGVGKLSDIVIRGGTLLSAADAFEEYRNPWQIFQPIPRKIFVPASASGATAALSGNVATTSAGTLTPQIGAPIAGASSTTYAGALTPSLSVALAGNAATAAVGALTVPGSFSAALTGNSATASAGTLSVGGPIVVALTGNAATCYAGLLRASGASDRSRLRQSSVFARITQQRLHARVTDGH